MREHKANVLFAVAATFTLAFPLGFLWGHTSGRQWGEEEFNRATLETNAKLEAAHAKGMADIEAAGEEARRNVLAAEQRLDQLQGDTEAGMKRLEAAVNRIMLSPPRYPVDER